VKLATCRIAGQARLMIAIDGGARLLDAERAAVRNGLTEPAFASMLALIDAGPAALEALALVVERESDEPSLSVPAAQAEFLAPVPEPRQMRDGMSFPLHIRQAPVGMRRLAATLRGETPAAEPIPDLPPVYKERPIYYITNRFSVAGHGSTVRWPRYSKVMDYELEFGIFIGRSGRDIPAARAREYIFGYTIYNDFSARDAQMLEMAGMLGPAKGKSFDGGNVLGPWIVTADEIGDPYSLKMAARVNGEVRASGDSTGMLFSFEEIIAYITREETLRAGEFIGSGTMGGGCGLETGRFLESGDTVELDVERIGVLRNTVVQLH
jgi:2-keto-4-pentenoate hydratase/2-oxohepta-3-ene-1,7-dioic acid hydratase in catechol pathway